MSKIEATIIKHSKCPRGHELITYELVFPRFILAELNVHRMFSKNSASSRAIPFKKMVEMVRTNPFKPIAYQAEHKGMQGSEYIANETGRGGDLSRIEVGWDRAVECAIEQATWMNDYGLTKQLCNRLLEPFMWHKVVLTTGLEGLRNFFELRCSNYKADSHENQYPQAHLHSAKSKKEAIKLQPTLSLRTDLEWLQNNRGQAEIHMMELAEQMYDAYNESVPQNLKENEWHVPYSEDLLNIANRMYRTKDIIKASTGMLARASYITVGDNKVPSIETLIGIHDKMVNARPKHSSPMEHCSKVMTEEEYYLFSKGMDGQKDHEHGWCYNYRGFMNYRYILEQTSQA